MTLSIHSFALETFVPMLRTLSQVLDKGAAHATAKGLDAATLVNAHLAPDMLPLAAQVGIACHHALDATARLTGQPPPVHGSAYDATFAEMSARIAQTIDTVQKIPASAFEGAETRDVTIAGQGDITFEMKGVELLRDWSFPNFYFHVVTAYDILRNAGVELGKRDYLARAAVYRRHGGKKAD